MDRPAAHPWKRPPLRAVRKPPHFRQPSLPDRTSTALYTEPRSRPSSADRLCHGAGNDHGCTWISSDQAGTWLLTNGGNTQETSRRAIPTRPKTIQNLTHPYQLPFNYRKPSKIFNFSKCVSSGTSRGASGSISLDNAGFAGHT